MRTFAQRQNQPQLPVSSKALSPNTEDLEVESSNKATARRAYDFSQIPVYATVPVKAQTKLTANTPVESTLWRSAPPATNIPLNPVWQHLATRTPIQPKLEVSKPGGPDEQEADRLAEQVMQTSGGGGSSPLSALQRLESGFGRDLSHVRLHTDDSAAQQARTIGARAFTSGNDIYFSHGALQPESDTGMRLLAHEVAHTFQQAEGRAPTGIAQRTEDWDFTPDDYKALVKAKGKLTFASDSDWFPKALQQNLIDTVVFVLTSKKPVRTTGVSIKDFYHGHFVVPKDTTGLVKKTMDFDDNMKKLLAKALGRWSAPVDDKSLPALMKTMPDIEKLATPLLEDALKATGAAVLYHTFEGHTPLDVRLGSETRNILTPVGGKPQGYDPSGTGKSANQYLDSYKEILQFAFLVDENGVIHVTVGGVTNLSRVTGTVMNS